jgi:hypothetical protein
MSIRKERIVSPTRIEVTGFNDTDNLTLGASEHVVDSGCKYIEDIQSRSVDNQCNLDNGGDREKGL